jgi:hypothetical protein
MRQQLPSCHPYANERCRVDAYALRILLIEIGSWDRVGQKESLKSFRD